MFKRGKSYLNIPVGVTRGTIDLTAATAAVLLSTPSPVVEVNPRTCNLSASVRKVLSRSWATLTWPSYMKLNKSFKSSAFTSHNNMTGW